MKESSQPGVLVIRQSGLTGRSIPSPRAICALICLSSYDISNIVSAKLAGFTTFMSGKNAKCLKGDRWRTRERDQDPFSKKPKMASLISAHHCLAQTGNASPLKGLYSRSLSWTHRSS